MEWKTINDYPNYQISKCGIVKNNKDKILKQRINRNGYQIINLSKGNIKKTFPIHRLIGMHYIERKNENLCILDHIDRDKLNNSIENLRWVDYNGNNRNKSVPNKYGYTGVYKRNNRYIARIRLNGFKTYLGSFETPEEAGDAYKNAYVETMKQYD